MWDGSLLPITRHAFTKDKRDLLVLLDTRSATGADQSARFQIRRVVDSYGHTESGDRAVDVERSGHGGPVAAGNTVAANPAFFQMRGADRSGYRHPIGPWRNPWPYGAHSPEDGGRAIHPDRSLRGPARSGWVVNCRSCCESLSRSSQIRIAANSETSVGWMHAA